MEGGRTYGNTGGQTPNNTSGASTGGSSGANGTGTTSGNNRASNSNNGYSAVRNGDGATLITPNGKVNLSRAQLEQIARGDFSSLSSVMGSNFGSPTVANSAAADAARFAAASSLINTNPSIRDMIRVPTPQQEWPEGSRFKGQELRASTGPSQPMPDPGFQSRDFFQQTMTQQERAEYGKAIVSNPVVQGLAITGAAALLGPVTIPVAGAEILLTTEATAVLGNMALGYAKGGTKEAASTGVAETVKLEIDPGIDVTARQAVGVVTAAYPALAPLGPVATPVVAYGMKAVAGAVVDQAATNLVSLGSSPTPTQTTNATTAPGALSNAPVSANGTPYYLDAKPAPLQTGPVQFSMGSPQSSGLVPYYGPLK